MSVHDVCLGTYNAFRGDEVVQSAEPTLYHLPGQYASVVARLAMLELGRVRSRQVDYLPAALSQEETETWFLRLAGGPPPILVRTIGGAEEVARGARVLQTMEEWSGRTGTSLEESAVERLLALHQAVDVDELLYALNCGRDDAVSRLESLGKRLQALVDRAHDDQALLSNADRAQLAAAEPAAAARAAQCAATLQRWRDTPAGVLASSALRAAVELLDYAETALSKPVEGSKSPSPRPFVAGAAWCVADAALTAFLARAQWLPEGRLLTGARPSVARYWERMRSRPASGGMERPFSLPGLLFGGAIHPSAIPFLTSGPWALPASSLPGAQQVDKAESNDGGAFDPLGAAWRAVSGLVLTPAVEVHNTIWGISSKPAGFGNPPPLAIEAPPPAAKEAALPPAAPAAAPAAPASPASGYSRLASHTPPPPIRRRVAAAQAAEVPAEEAAGLSAVDAMRVRAYNDTLKLARAAAAHAAKPQQPSADKHALARAAAEARLKAYESRRSAKVFLFAFLVLVCGAVVAWLALWILPF